MPLVLLELRKDIDNLTTAAAIEETIQISRLLAQNLSVKDRLNYSSLQTTVVSNPLYDDRTINATQESNSNCYNCGKKGHWAANCLSKHNSCMQTKNTHLPSSKIGNQNSTQRSQNVESKLKKGIRSFVDKYKKRNLHNTSKYRQTPTNNHNIGQRIYQVEEISSDEEEQSPAEKLESTNSEDEMNAILSELLSEQESE
ncbi:hypothetical protein FRX31_018172 [Thalictrum thalictroides]|uniref:CCHC-type domain-containing protein n=1 Tax=Thalictrum thalictroides TaxID=46969 RepID=A0A7J6W6Z1_THATH|nr:hypothetical protein FRX31_018172 [Thalictrum thalictroides]